MKMYSPFLFEYSVFFLRDNIIAADRLMIQ